MKNQNNRRHVYTKGYYVSNGYMGMVNGSYMLFASEEDYMEYVNN